jgi:hypothetical protein
LFAFQNKEKYPLQSELSGWPLFSVQKEFKRQNLPTDEWRLAEVNKNYTMSTFPAQFIVPASISDGTRHTHTHTRHTRHARAKLMWVRMQSRLRRV